MLLDGLNVILHKPRFPENIGMAARACANMGCPSLRVVCPELWRPERSLSLATPKGRKIIDDCGFFPDLRDAIADSHIVFAATARIGGWRRRVLSPAACAREIARALASGRSASLVFGSEDKGLTNEEIALCGGVVHIRTWGDASSLNLAQAVLLLLYECAGKRGEKTGIRRPENVADVRLGELALLERELKNVFELLDCSKGKNPEYHFLLWRGLLDRAGLKRHEFDALMGLCRQIKNKLAPGSRD